MIITISGTPGSGKSTVAKILVSRLGWERLYIGGTLRDLARQKGMTIEELTGYAKKHPEIDREVDQKTCDQARALVKKGKDVIVEGRVQFYFLPESLKIYMKVDVEEAARRIWNDLQDQERRGIRNEESVSSAAKVKEKILKREKDDAKRYKRLYGIDHRDEPQYDLIIDTTRISAERAAEKILKFIKELRDNQE